MKKLSIVSADEAVVFQQLPVDQSALIFLADQNDSETAHLVGLEQGQCVEELVARAKSSGKGNQRLGPQQKMHFAQCKISELKTKGRRDVQTIMRQFVGVRYGEVVSPLRGMKTTFLDAGHILGSAAISLRITEAGSTKVILFSGDLGRRQMPILRDPQPPPSCDTLIIESTYGDRLHSETAEEAKQKASALIQHAVTHQSKIIVPAFAVGRTQDLVMWIKEMMKEGRIPPIPIYIDSPLALRATEVFRQHPECYDEETYRILTTEGDPFIAKYIRYGHGDINLWMLLPNGSSQ